jgi:hypothetical protein
MERCRRDWIQAGLSWRALRVRRWTDVSTSSGGPTARSDSKSSDAIPKTWADGPRSLTFQAGSFRLSVRQSLPPETPYRGSHPCLTARHDPCRRAGSRVLYGRTAASTSPYAASGLGRRGSRCSSSWTTTGLVDPTPVAEVAMSSHPLSAEALWKRPMQRGRLPCRIMTGQ